jgi:hypothetical protein
MRSAPSWSSESTPEKPQWFDFCFINLNYTLVRVQTVEGDLTIRATADTFSPRRKQYFIRELAAEGFIPDDPSFLRSDSEPNLNGVRWLIDESWVKFDYANIARNHRLIKRFILPLTLSWLTLVYLAYPG